MPELDPAKLKREMQAATDAAKGQPTSGSFTQEKLPIYVPKKLRKDVDPARDELPPRRSE